MWLPMRDLSEFKDHPFDYKFGSPMTKTHDEAKKVADSVSKPTVRHFNFEGTGAESPVNIKVTTYNDPVNKPAHYNLNHKGIECIDAIEAALTPEEFRGYIKGNVLKYTWREKYKNGLEDNKKAVWYANKLVEVSDVKSV